jgi:glutamate-1-semialdehyde 2,1-aminomutase
MPDSKLWKKAKKIIPSGNCFLSKNPKKFPSTSWPKYFSRAKGCKIWDLNGEMFYDFYLMGVGTNVLGYADKDIDNDVIKEIRNSNVSSLNTHYEVDFASLLLKIHSWAHMVKFARTGAEANSLAVRASRAHNFKDKVIVCGYHGWHDWYLGAKLSKNYNKLETHLFPNLSINGVPKFLKNQTYSLAYGDFQSLQKIIIRDKNISCIIMEVGRENYPDKIFLTKVRKLCNKNQVNLIFDECTTGFREYYGGLHLKYGINPDIAMFGKSIGNGYAITSIIGKKKIFKNFKDTFASSTFWSEKIGFVAGISTLKKMKNLKSWNIIKKKGHYIKTNLLIIAKKNNLKIKFSGMDSLIQFSISGISDSNLNRMIGDYMIKKKILAGNKLYVSVSHSKKLIEKYIQNMDLIFKIIKNTKT